MSKVHDYVFHLLRDMISECRGRSEPRQFYYEIMSARGWMNPRFTNLVEEVIAFTQLIETDQPRDMSYEEIIQMAAEEWLMMDLGDFIINDRNLSNRLSDEQYRDAEDAARQKERVIREIERMLNSERRSSSRDGYRDDRRDRGGRDDRSYGRSERGGSRERFRDFGREGRRNRPGEGSMMSGGLGAARRRESEQALRESEERGTRRERSHDRGSERMTTREEPRQAPQVHEEKRPSGISRQEASRYSVDGPDFSKSRPYDDFMLNGEIWQAAHLSQFKLDPNEHPFLTAYDFNKKIRFMVKDQNGHIREEFIDMNKDLDYLRHELAGTDPREARRQAAESKRPQPKALSSDDQPAARQERPVKRIRLDLNLDKMNKVSLISSSVAEAEATIAMERVLGDNDVSARHVIITAPLLSDEATIEALEDIANARSLSEAAELLSDYRPSIDPVIYKTVNEKMAFRLAHAMRNEFGLKVKMSDFAGSYSKAYEWMRENRGEKWARNFSDKNRILIDEVFLCLSQKDKTGIDYLSGLFDMSEEDIAEKVKVTVTQDHFTVVSTKAKLKDLNLTLTEDPQLVCSREMPDLYGLIEESFAATQEISAGMGRIYLVTQDGERIEFFQNGLDKDAYLIARMV